MGVYEKRLPTLSTVGRFLSTGVGLMITVSFIFVIIMVLYLPGIMRTFTKNAAEEDEKAKDEQIEERIRAEVERLKRENASPDSLPEPKTQKNGDSADTEAGTDATADENEQENKIADKYTSGDNNAETPDDAAAK